jgi:hypothetical protein
MLVGCYLQAARISVSVGKGNMTISTQRRLFNLLGIIVGQDPSHEEGTAWTPRTFNGG